MGCIFMCMRKIMRNKKSENLKTKKMKVKFIWASAMASMLLFSCNSENEDFYPESDSKDSGDLPTSYKVSPDEAQLIVLDFMNGLSSSPTRGIAGNREISDIKVLKRSSLETRAAENLSIDLDTLMYFVNFSNNQGYAIVSADKRTEPIFAFVESGNFSLDSTFTEEDDPFLEFLDRAISTEIEDINNYVPSSAETRTTVNGWTINSSYGPILKTQWSQGGKSSDSYGKYCPNYTTGCTVTATAQIMSHFKTISSVSWKSGSSSGSATMHWYTIVSDSERYNGMLYSSTTPQSLEEVAQFCRYLGVCFGAKYNSNSTSVDKDEPIKWFNKRANLNATSLKSFNESAIINAIKAGNPVYARGNSGRKKFLGITYSYTGGHAWVYDGYISATKDGKTQNMIHCNWGWGPNTGNGFYASKVFNTNVGPEIYDYEVTRGSDYHYRYNLEYSIISRK